jgi:hypothetical protein
VRAGNLSGTAAQRSCPALCQEVLQTCERETGGALVLPS